MLVDSIIISFDGDKLYQLHLLFLRVFLTFFPSVTRFLSVLWYQSHMAKICRTWYAVSHERFLKLSAEYEAEQNELTKFVKKTIIHATDKPGGRRADH